MKAPYVCRQGSWSQRQLFCTCVARRTYEPSVHVVIPDAAEKAHPIQKLNVAPKFPPYGVAATFTKLSQALCDAKLASRAVSVKFTVIESLPT